MKQQLLKLICDRSNGISVPEAMSITGLDYAGIMAAVSELCAEGYRIGAIKIGRSIYRLYPMSE
jgi:hypothetical protein